ncbi:MAG: hypothetical protein AAF549_01420, partial [Pseudomonadota bacterium]
ADLIKALESDGPANITTLIEALDNPEVAQILADSGIAANFIEAKLESVAQDTGIPVETLKEQVRTIAEIETIIANDPQVEDSLQPVLDQIKNDPAIADNDVVQAIIENIATGKDDITPSTASDLTNALAASIAGQNSFQVERVSVGESAKLESISQKLGNIANQVSQDAPLNKADQTSAPTKTATESIEAVQNFTEKLAQGKPVSETEVIVALTQADTALSKMDNGPLKSQLEAVRQEIAQQVKDFPNIDQELIEKPGPGGCKPPCPCCNNTSFNNLSGVNGSNPVLDPTNPSFDPKAVVVKTVDTVQGPQQIFKTAEQVHAETKAVERIIANNQTDATQDLSGDRIQAMQEAIAKQYGQDGEAPNIIKAEDAFAKPSPSNGDSPCPCADCFGEAAPPTANDNNTPSVTSLTLGGEKIDTSSYSDPSSSSLFDSSSASSLTTPTVRVPSREDITFEINDNDYTFIKPDTDDEMPSIFGGCADCTNNCGDCGDTTTGETTQAPRNENRGLSAGMG